MLNRFSRESVGSRVPGQCQSRAGHRFVTSFTLMDRRESSGKKGPVAMALAVGVGLLCLLTPFVACSAPPEHEIKLATLAPENSTLMKIFNDMNAELLKESGGKVGFKIFSGFAMGDEDDVLRKLRAGMVHAASFTMGALTDLNPDLRVLQVPFLFDNYQEVDHVLGKLDADLRRGFSERGLEILGWPELGFLYFMSTTPIASLNDIKGKKVWARANAPMSQAFTERVGVSTVAIGAPDVLMALQTNLVDVVYNSPYYAVVTQWNTQVKYLTDLPLAYVGGALVLDKRVLTKMPAPLQDVVKRVCGKYARLIGERTRQDNAEAMNLIFTKGVKRITPGVQQVEEFKKMSDETMASLDPRVLSPVLLKNVKGILSEYRKSRKP